MDLSALGTVHLDISFFSALLCIVLIDLILAGDNAVFFAGEPEKLMKRRQKSA